MKTTLLISTYNWPQALGKVLDSVLRQTVLPDEVVIADDGSGEETRRLIAAKAQGFPIPLVHVWHEDKGFRKTLVLNKAIARATGDYIMQIDGDVVLERHFVADHLEVAEEGCFVCGSRVKLTPAPTQRLHFAGVRKKALKMGGVQYHLYHKEASRSNESRHNEELRRVLDGRIAWCGNGLRQVSAD